jgi:hypothetical protein
MKRMAAHSVQDGGKSGRSKRVSSDAGTANGREPCEGRVAVRMIAINIILKRQGHGAQIHLRQYYLLASRRVSSLPELRPNMPTGAVMFQPNFVGRWERDCTKRQWPAPLGSCAAGLDSSKAGGCMAMR